VADRLEHGTGEMYAARRDDADLHVLGIARTFAEAETALQGWASHANQPGGLDWAIERTRDLTGDGELSLHLSRLRADLTQLASHPEPLGRARAVGRALIGDRGAVSYASGVSMPSSCGTMVVGFPAVDVNDA
jgi:hypothetical protein